MKQATEYIETLAPFLALYPSWVKVLLAAWVILSALLLLAFLLAPRSPGGLDLNDPRFGLKLHTFSDDDAKLQTSRIELAKTFLSIIDKGVDEAAVEAIFAASTQQYNSSLRFKIRKDLAPLHIEEADAIHSFLQARLISIPKNKATADAIRALGHMHHNMLSIIRILERRP